MPKPDARKIAAASVNALMHQRFGGPNKSRLGREAKIGQGGGQRAVEGKIGLDVLGKLAVFARCEPWQLLVPGFDPDKKPRLATPDTAANEPQAM